MNFSFLSSYDPNERKIISCIRNNDVSGVEKYIQNGYSINHHVSRSVQFTDQLLKFSPSLICLSAFYNSPAVFRYLMINNADLQDTDTVRTPISHFAVAGENLEIVTLIDEINETFEGAIFVAAERGSMNMFIWVYTNHFCDIHNIRNENGESVLSLVSKTNNSNLISLVLELTKDDLELNEVFELMREFSYNNRNFSSDYGSYDESENDFY